MTLLRIIKRSPGSINVAVDYNPSVFRYFIANQEMKRDVVKDGLKPAFFAMLDVLILPNSSNFEELSNWTFSNPIAGDGSSGGQTTTINTYDGVKYVYRPSISTLIRAAVPAVLNGFAGKTYFATFDMMLNKWIYTQTTDLLKITHAELIDPPNPPEILDIEAVWIDTSGAIPAQYDVTPQGYFPVQGLEIGTHGKDGFAFRPLSFWNETTTGQVGEEYTGIIKEEKSSFSLDSKLINCYLTATGEALPRYNPIDLITFVELIKLHYNYRENVTTEKDL